MTGLGDAGGPGWREPGAPPTTLDPSSSQPNVNASRPKTQTQKKTNTNIKAAEVYGAMIQGKINCNCPDKCEQLNGGNTGKAAQSQFVRGSYGHLFLQRQLISP